MSKRFLRVDGVCSKAGFKRSKLYQMLRAGSFPGPSAYIGSVPVWTDDVINQWIDSTVEAHKRDGPDVSRRR